MKTNMTSASESFKIGKELQRTASFIKQQMKAGVPPTYQSVADQITESLGIKTSANMVKNLKDDFIGVAFPAPPISFLAVKVFNPSSGFGFADFSQMFEPFFCYKVVIFRIISNNLFLPLIDTRISG